MTLKKMEFQDLLLGKYENKICEEAVKLCNKINYLDMHIIA
jgi:hypothetical protein